MRKALRRVALVICITSFVLTVVSFLNIELMYQQYNLVSVSGGNISVKDYRYFNATLAWSGLRIDGAYADAYNFQPPSDHRGWRLRYFNNQYQIFYPFTAPPLYTIEHDFELMGFEVGVSKFTGTAQASITIFLPAVFAMSLLFLIYKKFLRIRRIRKMLRKRRSKTHCPKCGYDLRESKDYCPECGTPIEKKR